MLVLIVSPLLPAPCDECVSSVLYTGVFTLLPAHYAMCVSHIAFTLLPVSGVSTVGPRGARAPLTFSILNVIIK